MQNINILNIIEGMKKMKTISSDTIGLLKECNSGIKMGVNSIDDVYDRVSSDRLKKILDDSKDKHSKLGNRTHTYLNSLNYDEKDPHPMAKVMSWTKTNMKLAMNESDQTIADLMTEGCNMGIKSLNKYLNQYTEADEEAKSIAKELIAIEQSLVDDVKEYL